MTDTAKPTATVPAPAAAPAGAVAAANAAAGEFLLQEVEAKLHALAQIVEADAAKAEAFVKSVVAHAKSELAKL
jgi:hypothetical protein